MSRPLLANFKVRTFAYIKPSYFKRPRYLYKNLMPESFSCRNCEAAVLLLKAFLCLLYKNVCCIKSVILALLRTVLQYVICRRGLRRLGLQTIICSGFQPPLGRRGSLCYLMFQRTVSSSHRLLCHIITLVLQVKQTIFNCDSIYYVNKNRRVCLYVSVQCELRFARTVMASDRPVRLLVNHASPAARPHVSHCGLTLLAEWTRQERCSF